MRKLSVQPEHRQIARYPDHRSGVEARELIRLHIGRLFSPLTMMMAGALGYLAYLGNGSAARAADEPVPARSAEDIAREVAVARSRYVQEAETAAAGRQFSASRRDDNPILSANPALVGVFPLAPEAGQEVLGKMCVPMPPDQVVEPEKKKWLETIALEMFKIYGVELAVDAPVDLQDADGRLQRVDFQADGFDAVRRVGFEILYREEQSSHAAHAEEHPEASRVAAKSLLTFDEMQPFNEWLNSKTVSFFAAYVDDYDRVELSPVEQAQAFIDSLVRYLDWLKSQGRI